MIDLNLGKATIDPDGAIIAGSFTTLTYTYTAGHPIDDSGYIKITFRSVSDCGTPQFDHPSKPNYCTVSTTGYCRIEPRWDPKGNTRPWSQALYLKIRYGYLDKDERIQVIFGDTSKGSPGWQVQTNCVKWFEFKTFVDPIATYKFKELPVSPGFQIIPGESVKAVCISTVSQVKVNRPFTYFLKLEDRWGNPTGKPIRFTHPGFHKRGVHRVKAIDEETGLTATSNPIDVQEDFRLLNYWGDFHGQSEETVGEGTIEEYFSFARDYGLLDISAHSGNDFQITDEFWEKINRVTREFYKPGEFVTFPGYEWSGNTPLGGDRNVFYASEGGQITRSCTDLLPDNRTTFSDSPTANDLFCKLREQDGPTPFNFAHVGGRYADLAMHDPEIELAVEVHSAWGTFEWFLAEALEHGYRVGFCANSDGHKCRPGASYPGAGIFGSLGGLTCVLAGELTRESVLEALKARHFYATTGNRPLLDVRLNSRDRKVAMMGDIVETSNAENSLDIRVTGTKPIEHLQVRNGTDVIHNHRPYDESDLGPRIKIVWRGSEVKGRDRLTTWDGGLQVKDNVIISATPINFWNANQPLQKPNNQQLKWKSVTTGGLSGVIMELEDPYNGSIHIDTTQGQVVCEVSSASLEPQIWEYGGLQKQLCLYRLPSRNHTTEISINLPLLNLQSGDNPIYIYMEQEDGHMAWSSPIYLVV